MRTMCSSPLTTCLTGGLTMTPKGSDGMSQDNQNVKLVGVPASEGIAIGPAFVLEDEDVAIPRWDVPKDRVKSEVARFRYALGRTKDEMVSIHNKALKVFGKSHARLMDAYLLILNDPFLNK